MRIELKPFRDESPEDWSHFVKECDEAWVFHTASFIDAFPYDFSFSIRIDGSIRGICVMGRVRRRSGAYFVGPGMALSAAAKNATVYGVLRTKLKDLAVSAGCQGAEFTLSPMAPAHFSKKFADSILYQFSFSEGARWRKSWETLPGFFSVIDLGLDVTQIIRGFSKGNKASVSRCKKLGLGLEVQTGQNTNRESWQDFVTIHRQTYRRSNGEPFSDERLDHLFLLVQSGHMALVNGIENGICVSSLLLATDKSGAFYYAGGAFDDARQKGIMAWTHSEAIRWLKENGYKRYCLGFTITALEGTVGGAIGDSKNRFGGNKWPMLCGDLILRPASFFIFQMAPEIVHLFLRVH